MIAWLSPPPPERRILSGSAMRSITPWIVAVMSFTIVLAGACGLVTSRVAAELGGSIGQRYVMIVPAGAGSVEPIAARLRALPGVRGVEPVSEESMRGTLKRWLGPSAQSADLPIPALVKFELAEGADLRALRPALLRSAAGGRISSYEYNVAPLLGSLRLVQWVAVALIILLGAAACSAVVLAARGAIDSHRPIVDVLHGIGATDNQVARIFQYRIAIDTLVGSLAGAAAATLILLVVAGSARWAADMSGLSLSGTDFLILAALPLLLTAIATLAARAAILAALREAL